MQATEAQLQQIAKEKLSQDCKNQQGSNEKEIKEQKIVDSESEDEKNNDPVKKKKKKKNKKKKKPQVQEMKPATFPQVQGVSLQILNAQTQTNDKFRCLGGWKTPVKIMFPNQRLSGYEANEIHQYKVPRVKTEELKKREQDLDAHLMYLRKAAEIQRQVRRFAQRIIIPGRRLVDICEQLENYNRKLTNEHDLEAGIAFPTGCSLNHVAAHFTPASDCNRVLGVDDVCKIDFGTHVKGRIIDCAFTVAFNPKYDKLLEAVKDATDTGIRAAGIDVRLGEIGQLIQETMESYEVDLGQRVKTVRVVRNLNGHSIDPYKIHSGKTVPCIKSNSAVKMEEGEQYAIETFGSTGNALVVEDGECSHYMKDLHLPSNVRIPGRSKQLYKYITQKYSTLCFAKRWLDKQPDLNYFLPLRDLVQNGIINTYPPLCDKEGSYVAQWEHTLILRPFCKEVLSRGEDY